MGQKCVETVDIILTYSSQHVENSPSMYHVRLPTDVAWPCWFTAPQCLVVWGLVTKTARHNAVSMRIAKHHFHFWPGINLGIGPLKHLETPWNTLKHLETPWNTLKHLETPWNTSHQHIAIPSTKTTCLACWDSLTGESPMSLSSHDFIRTDGSEELFFAAFAKCFRVSGGVPNWMLDDTVPSGYVKIAIENGHLWPFVVDVPSYKMVIFHSFL